MASMARAYDMAAIALRQRIAEQHPDRLDVLDGLAKQDIAVYKGQYDSVEEVLRRLSVPFNFDPTARNLRKARVAFANCTGSAHRVLTSDSEPFAREGGWLVSTDWSLQSVIQPCFPNTIRRKSGRNSGDEVVAVEPNTDSLWSEVMVPGADPQWWLEASSYPIDVLDTERVRIEAASHELLVKYDAPVVSARFDWHDGHVYHVISHMWLKRSRVPQKDRYRAPCTEFLRDGMRLSEEGIEKVLAKSRVSADSIDFATIQSAATTTELVAQLCIEAAQGASPRGDQTDVGGFVGAIKKVFL